MASKDADVKCRLSNRDLENIRKQFNIPDNVILELPTPYDRVNHFDPHRLALHDEVLRIGVAFPFQGLVADVLRTFRLAPGQLTPNSWRIILEIERWAGSHRVRLTGRSLLELLTVRRSGDFLSVQGIGKLKVVSGMPSWSRDWKPYFFFARCRNEAGKIVMWDVPVKWRNYTILPEAKGLTKEEGDALKLLRATLKEAPLPYTAPRVAVEGRIVGMKRSWPDERPQPESRSQREAGVSVPLSPLSTSIQSPSPESPAPPKRKKIGGREAEKRALRAAQRESLRSFEAEQELLAAEEEEFQMALRVSAAAAEGRLLKGPAPTEASVPRETSGQNPRQSESSGSDAVESVSSSEASSTGAGSGESSSFDGSGRRDQVGERVGVPRRDSTEEAAPPIETLQEVINLTMAGVTIAVTGAESWIVETSIPGVDVLAIEALEATTTSAVSSVVADVRASEAAVPVEVPVRGSAPGPVVTDVVLSAVGAEIAPATTDEVRLVPPQQKLRTMRDLLNLDLPELVRRARAQVLPTPSMKFAIPSPIRGDELRARAAQTRRKYAKRATSRSPLDTGSMGAARADQLSRVQTLIRPVGNLKLGHSLVQPSSEAMQEKLKAAGKEAVLPPAPQRLRRRGGPGGKEIGAKDVSYDLYALDSLPQLSERQGRPMLPGTGSHRPGNLCEMLRQRMSKLSADMLTLGRDYGNSITELCQDEIARIESEVRTAAFEEGRHSVESERFEQVACLDNEILSLKNRVFTAENIADSAVRERDSKVAKAARSKAKKKMLKAEIKQLKESWLTNARAEVQREISDLTGRIVVAEAAAAEANARAASAEGREALLKQWMEALTSDAEVSMRALAEELIRREQLETSMVSMQGSLGVAEDKAASCLARAEAAEATSTTLVEEVMALRLSIEVAEGESAARLARAEAAEATSATLAEEVTTLRLKLEAAEGGFRRAEPAAEDSALAEVRRLLSEKTQEVQELRARLEESEFRESLGSAQYYNAAVSEIQEAYPELDLRRFIIDINGPSDSSDGAGT